MKIKDMEPMERKVYEACRNGWFVGGEYSASFGGHRRRFFADSPRWLHREVAQWIQSHAEHHADEHVLIKFAA